MSAKPLVSIIIPVYNAEKYLTESIESALNQTWGHKEIIIIDDGSTDNSYQIAKRYESDIVKIYRQENLGGSAARNLGFEKSNGDYIQYLDADDLLSEDKIERQMVLFEKFGDDIAVTCKTLRFKEGLIDMKNTGEAVCKDYDDPYLYLIDNWQGKGFIGLHGWLFPRNIVQKVGKWDTSLVRGQDGDFLTKTFFYLKKIKYNSMALAYYRNTEGSISKRNFINSAPTIYKICEYVVYNIVLPAKRENIRKAFIHRLSTIIYQWYPLHAAYADKGLYLLKELGVTQPVFDCYLKNMLSYLLGWKNIRKIEINLSGLKKRTIRYFFIIKNLYNKSSILVKLNR